MTSRGGSWRLFAFHHLRPENWQREQLPDERLERAIRWAAAHDVTTIVLERDSRPPFPSDVTHHLCSDPACPGGC